MTNVDVSYETSGYDDRTLRAVATVVSVDGGRTLRGSWEDGETKALLSLAEKAIASLLNQHADERRRYQQERDTLQGEVEGLRAEINRVRQEIAKTPVSALQIGFKEVQIQRASLEAEVVAQRAKLARFAAAVETLNQAIK